MFNEEDDFGPDLIPADDVSAQSRVPALDFSSMADPVEAPFRAPKGLDFSGMADPVDERPPVDLPLNPPLPPRQPMDRPMSPDETAAEAIRLRKGGKRMEGEPVVEPPKPATEAAPTPPNAFSRGFVSGMLEQNPEMTAEALEGFSHLAPTELGDVLRGGSDEVRKLMKLSPEAYKRRAGSMWDIKGFDDALTWAGETVGQGLASSVPSLVMGGGGAVMGGRVGGKLGALVGAGGGAAIPSFALNYGEVYKALKDEKVEPKRSAELALYAGGAMAVLDAWNPTAILARGMGLTEAKREVARHVARRVLAEAGKGAGREALTETAQEAVKEATVALETGKPFFTVETGKKLIESGVAGGLTGGVMGGPVGIRPDRVVPAPSPSPVPEAAPPADVPPPGTSPIEQVLGGAPEPAVAPAAPSAEQLPAPVTQPDRGVSAGQRRVLRKKGWLDDQIDGMSPAEVEAELGEAVEQGIEPDDVVQTSVQEPAPRPDVMTTAPQPAQPEPTPDQAMAGLSEMFGGTPPAAETAVETAAPDFSEQAAAVEGEGTRTSPVKVNDPLDIERAGERVNTEPSDAQKEAGNYQKGHLKFHGLDIAIENPAGSVRTGKRPDGTEWQAQLPVAYGYIKRTTGKDGDQVDVYLQGDGPIHVIDQIDPATGKFDEHKVVIGPASPEEATALYRAAFDDSGAVNRVGAITPLSLKELKAWLRVGRRTRPLGKIEKPDTGPVSVGPLPEVVYPDRTNVEEAIKTAGVLASSVDPADIDAAAQIVAETGADPAEAFQQAMAEQIEEQADDTGGVPARVEDGAEGGQQKEGGELPGGGETRPDQAVESGPADQAGQADFSDQADAVAETENAEVGAAPYVETALDKKERIEDAGEKIGGARKDQWAGGLKETDLEGMTGAEKAKNVTKEKVWPKIDYAQLVEDGVDPEAAYLIKMIYDKLPTSPQARNEVTLSDQIKYINVLQAIRDEVAKVKVKDDLRDIKKRVNEAISGNPNEWGTEDFGPALQRRRGKWVYRHPAELSYRDQRNAEEAVKKGFPNIEPWQRLYRVYESEFWKDVPGTSYKKGDKRYVVTRKNSGANLGEFGTREEAEAKAKDLYENRGAEGDERGQEPKRPHLDKVSRVGPDVRNSKDVGSEDFIKDFGFRGVEFGNWVAGDERQKTINLAYDALHDLARILNLPVKALSLNGTLGVGFGSRGKGGKAAAHYEPTRLVINMTKMTGAGSLAHEWAHALDHYLGEQHSKAPYGGAPQSISGWDDVAVKKGTYANRRIGDMPPRLNRTANALMQALHFKFETDERQKVRAEELEARYKSGRGSWEKSAERAKDMLRKGENTRLAHGMLRKAESQFKIWDRWYKYETGKAPTKELVETDYYSEAKKLSGKSGDYWYRPTELFARSFESYVFDRLAEEGDGHKSQYLVQGVEPDRFGNGFRGNPYPSGDERTAINKAFDDFVKALEAVEGKAGEGSRITGKTAEDPAPVIEETTPVPQVTAEQKEDQLEAEMAALDQSTEALESGEETVNRSMVLASRFAQHLRDGEGFANILVARKMAKDAGFDGDAKAVEEALELAVVMVAREIVADRTDPKANFRALTDLYSRQPKLGSRTSTSMRDQAFSTPVPLAYVASRLAGIGPNVSVYEPSAGNGALLIEATPHRVTANEINPDRAENLRSMGFGVTSKDASKELNPPASDHVIANPPFGAVRQDGESEVFDLSDIQNGYKTKEIDHAIALRALSRLPEYGRAVLILGGLNKLAQTREARSDGYNGKAKREFYKTLYDRYNVVDHFTVAGELYERQGAGWPVDVIVIDGRGQSKRALPAVDVPRVLTTWNELGGLLDADASVSRRGDRASEQDADGVAGERPASGNVGDRGDGERVSEPDAAADQPSDVQRGPVQRPGHEASGGQGRVPAGDERGDAIGTGEQPDAERRPPRLDDFDAAFDAALDETFGPQAGPKSSSGERKRSTGEVAKSAVKNVAGSADDAMSALVQMFGGGKTLNMGVPFTPENYKKARPLLESAATKFVAFKDDVTELVRRMVGELQRAYGLTREGLQDLKPFLKQFIAEVRSGAIRLGAAPKAAEQKPATPTKQEKETDKQVSYAPKSRVTGLGTLVPVNMRSAISDALDAIEARVGPLDAYVAKELGYSHNQGELQQYFAAEQVDALAGAIDNIERGKGYIIGDQTGIGKGRVNAAIIRYAIKKGLVPVFVTEKPNLYGDMYRDLTDIGIKDFLGRDINILATNSDLNVPLTDEGDVVLRTGDSKQHSALLRGMTADKLKSYDAVFTNYSQMQTVKGEDTTRRGFLGSIAPNAVVIFDESHNAGGQGKAGARVKKGQPANRSGFARELVTAARGVFYSSATYAKRPDVMDLYAATDMAMAVEKIEDLAEAIARGGVPMQQVVASMLAKGGQYIRRERSFAGVTYNTPLIEVDRDQYDGISQGLELIQRFSLATAKAAEKMDTDIKAEAAALGHDNATGDAGASSTLFTSIMHNIINQMLLAMKARPAAQMAIEALKRGEKPVLTVANTMESFLTKYAEDIGVKPGDVLDVDFSQVLQKYLDRTRTIIIKKPFSKDPVIRHYLTDEELGPVGLAAYRSAQAQIASLDLSDLPVSPIDRIKQDLTDAGYSVGEITGRGTVIDYSGDEPVFRNRPGKETSIRGRREAIARFNSGATDAIVLNQAGATGLSLHASEKFKDQRQRHMMIVQAEANIDTHMQMLGRVHRTGQIIVPIYSQLVANIPAEKRPAAVLAKKMASLNANTTASRGGALTAKDVPDFINEYGDMVAATVISDGDGLNQRLGNPIKIDENGRIKVEDAMRRLTGRIPLLPLKEQEELYERLESDYTSLLEQMEAAGENALEAKTVDFRARTAERTVVVPAKSGSTSPFAAPVTIEKVSIVRQGKPYTPAEVMQRLGEQVGALGGLLAKTPADEATNARLLRQIGDQYDPIGSVVAEKHRAAMDAALVEFTDYQRGVLDQLTVPDRIEKERLKLNTVKDRFTALFGMLPTGARITLKTAGGNYTSIVLKVERTGKASNPLALSSWKATFLVADSSRQVTFPLSRLFRDGTAAAEDRGAVELKEIGWESAADTLGWFAKMQSTSREERFIATGNLLAAYDWLNMKGRILNYTDDQGTIRQGVLTAKDFDLNKHYGQKARPIRDPAEVVAWLKNNRHKIMWSEDNVVRLMLDATELHVTAEAAKRTGGVYYLDRPLTELTHDFYRRGPVMTTSLYDPGDSLTRKIVERLQSLGAVFVDRSEATPPPSEKVDPAPAQDEGRTSVVLTRSARSQRRALDRAVIDAVADVAGLDVARRVFTAERLDNRPGQDWNATQDEEVVGVYYPDREGNPTLPLIEIALAGNPDAVRTAYHEGWHAIEGTLTPAEVDILRRETARLRAKTIEYHPEHAGVIETAEAEEIWAEAAAIYTVLRARGESMGGVHIAARRVFEKIVRLMARIRNGLAGLGFRSAEDIFEGFARGDMASRRRGMAPQGRRRWWASASEPSTAVGLRPGYNVDVDADPEAELDALPESVREAWAQPDKSFKERLSDAIDAFLVVPARALWDRQIDLLRFQKASEAMGRRVGESLDTYLAASLYPGKVGERMKDATRQMWEPLFDAMQARGFAGTEGRKALHDYLYARHAIERNAAIREIDPDNTAGSGMTDAEAQVILDRASDRQADFDALAAMVDEIVSFNRDAMVRAGLESAETVEQWEQKYRFYVPLKGFEAGTEDELGGSPSSGQGFDVRRPETRRALGRFDRADDILANLLDQTQRTIIRAEKNAVAKTFMRFAQSNRSPFWKFGLAEKGRRVSPDTGLVEDYWYVKNPDRENIFAAKVGGKTYYMEIKHQGLLEALKTLGADRLNPFMRLAARLTREYSRFQTAKNPEFVLTNLARDIQDAGFTINGETRDRYVKAYFKALVNGRALFGAVLGVTERGDNTEYRRWFEEWREAGGKISHYGLRDIEEIKNDMVRELNQRTETTAKSVALAIPRLVNPINGKVVKFLEAISDVTETTTRLAVYIAAREAGLSKAEAARMSRNATVDFNRRGKYGSPINALYAFANANIQGNIRLLRVLRKSRLARRTAGAIIIAGMVMTLWNLAVSPEDEEKKSAYEKRNYWERERNLIIYWPGMSKDSIAPKIPLGYGLNVFWMMGEQLAMRMMGKVGTVEAIGNILGTTVSAFNPLGSNGSFFDWQTWVRAYTPTVLRFLPDYGFNRNTFDRPIHPDPMPWNDKLPHSGQHKAFTHPVAIAMADKLNRLTGGNMYEPGGLDFYPDDIEYAWNFVGGGLGRFMSNTSGAIADYVDGVERPIERIPFVRRFVVADNTSAAQADAYYKRRTEERAKAQRLRAAIRGRAEGKTDEATEDVIERLARETGARPSRNNRGVSIANEAAFRAADREIKALRTEEERIRDDQKLSRAQKAEQIKALRQQMRDVMGRTRADLPAQ